MSHFLNRFAFLGVISAMLILFHYYLWVRKVRDTQLPQPLRRIVTLLLAFGCVVVVGTFLTWRLRSDHVGPVLFAAFVWLGSFFYLVLFWAGWDFLRLTRWLGGLFVRRPPIRSATDSTVEADSAEADPIGGPVFEGAPQIDRRVFLTRGFAGLSALSTTGVAFAGVRSALDQLTEPVVEVTLPRLPLALDGFRIALLTDMHIGPVLDRHFVSGVVERVNRTKPDLVAITGDLVDGPVGVLGDEIAPLAELRSRCGTFFVTGNHEFYVGARQWIRFLPRLGIRVLDNEHVAVGDPSSRGASFDLAGIHDPAGRRLEPEFAPDIDKAVANRDESRELVLLAHQPAHIWAAVNSGASFQLSGHTHGGQLWPFGALVLLAQPYLAGLYQHDENTQIYVSRGTGFWGPPMRVLAPAEITTIVLKARG